MNAVYLGNFNLGLGKDYYQKEHPSNTEDKYGIVHTSIGKVSFSEDKIADNAREFMTTIMKLKPTSAKGIYVKSVYLSSTMSPGIKIDTRSIDE